MSRSVPKKVDSCPCGCSVDARAADVRAQPVVAWYKGRAGGVDEKEKGLVRGLYAKKEPQKVHVGKPT